MTFIELKTQQEINDARKDINDFKTSNSNTIHWKNPHLEIDDKEEEKDNPTTNKKVKIEGKPINHVSFNLNNYQVELGKIIDIDTIPSFPDPQGNNGEFRILVYPGNTNDYLQYTYRKTKHTGVPVTLVGNPNKQIFKIENGRIDFSNLYKDDATFGKIQAYGWICSPRCQTKFQSEL